MQGDGGPAFPSEQHETQDGTWNQTYDPGMTLRDWFAGQALAGNLAAEDMGEGAIPRLRSEENAAVMARRAYQMADAMLAARKQEATRDAD